MTTTRRRNLSPARIPCATYVEVMLCSCGCGIYYCYLMDDDDEPIAKFGYKAEEKPFTGEPARTNLIQPPTGYQTPSPNYPYGVGVKNNSVKDLPAIKDRAVGAGQ